MAQQVKRIGLVAAAKVRRGGVCQAREQFERSPVFRRARDYCERTYDEWYILSAEHALLPPQQVIGPDGASGQRPVRARCASAQAKIRSTVKGGSRCWLRTPRCSARSRRSELPRGRPRPPALSAISTANQVSSTASRIRPSLARGHRAVRAKCASAHAKISATWIIGFRRARSRLGRRRTRFTIGSSIIAKFKPCNSHELAWRGDGPRRATKVRRARNRMC